MDLYETLPDPDKQLVDNKVEHLLKMFNRHLLPEGAPVLSDEVVNTIKMGWRESLSTSENLATLRAAARDQPGHAGRVAKRRVKDEPKIGGF